MLIIESRWDEVGTFQYACDNNYKGIVLERVLNHVTYFILVWEAYVGRVPGDGLDAVVINFVDKYG